MNFGGFFFLVAALGIQTAKIVHQRLSDSSHHLSAATLSPMEQLLTHLRKPTRHPVRTPPQAYPTPHHS
jgi:hypothetical protein